mmetsp:Transcript_1509/g.4959  ORF Transcript_1509/g.4959 Transcript_1509/m.4959 type:complete len:227 (-) Transcript_1509:148-828(-)
MISFRLSANATPIRSGMATNVSSIFARRPITLFAPCGGHPTIASDTVGDRLAESKSSVLDLGNVFDLGHEGHEPSCCAGAPIPCRVSSLLIAVVICSASRYSSPTSATIFSRVDWSDDLRSEDSLPKSLSRQLIPRLLPCLTWSIPDDTRTGTAGSPGPSARCTSSARSPGRWDATSSSTDALKEDELANSTRSPHRRVLCRSRLHQPTKSFIAVSDVGKHRVPTT